MNVILFSDFLLKENAYDYVKTRGPLRLYKLALFYLCNEVVQFLISHYQGNLHIHLVVATINITNRQENVLNAIEDISKQLGGENISDSSGQGRNVNITPNFWESESSAGLQIADYGLWAIQRYILLKRAKAGFFNMIRDRIAIPPQFPWGENTRLEE